LISFPKNCAIMIGAYVLYYKLVTNHATDACSSYISSSTCPLYTQHCDSSARKSLLKLVTNNTCTQGTKNSYISR